MLSYTYFMSIQFITSYVNTHMHTHTNIQHSAFFFGELIVKHMLLTYTSLFIGLFKRLYKGKSLPLLDCNY